MKRIGHFFNWLFDYGTSPLFPLLFIIGTVLGVIFIGIALFVIAPLLGFLFCGALFFGIPYVAYRVALAEERDE